MVLVPLGHTFQLHGGEVHGDDTLTFLCPQHSATQTISSSLSIVMCGFFSQTAHESPATMRSLSATMTAWPLSSACTKTFREPLVRTQDGNAHRTILAADDPDPSWCPCQDHYTCYPGHAKMRTPRYPCREKWNCHLPSFTRPTLQPAGDTDELERRGDPQEY